MTSQGDHGRACIGDIDREKLNDLVRRILSVVEPRRIVLFGSFAMGVMRADSDLDILVVLANGASTSEAEKAIYRNLWGFGFAVDVIAVTEEDVQRFRPAHGFHFLHIPSRKCVEGMGPLECRGDPLRAPIGTGSSCGKEPLPDGRGSVN